MNTFELFQIVFSQKLWNQLKLPHNGQPYRIGPTEAFWSLCESLSGLVVHTHHRPWLDFDFSTSYNHENGTLKFKMISINYVFYLFFCNVKFTAAFGFIEIIRWKLNEDFISTARQSKLADMVLWYLIFLYFKIFIKSRQV
jgi:hypothetical protein